MLLKNGLNCAKLGTNKNKIISNFTIKFNLQRYVIGYYNSENSRKIDKTLSNATNSFVNQVNQQK
jgi:hypothetical protein